MKRVFCLILIAVCLFPLPGCIRQPEPEIRRPFVKPDFSMSIPTFYQNPLTGLHDRSTPYEGRPFSVSVNNITYGLPQSGITAADIVVEIETEGGITRLMCLFTEPEKATGGIGSIRSLRHQFIGAVYQWDPVIVHIGTSTYTDDFMWARGIRTMNGYNSESFITVDAERKKNYASEHTKFTDYEHLQAGMSDPVFSLSPEWHPAEATAFHFAPRRQIAAVTGGIARMIHYEFSRDYDGDFRYDTATGTYFKYQHGSPHVDEGNAFAQLSFTNVLVLLAPVYGLFGELIDVDFRTGGEGFYFYGGSYEHFTWTKPDYNQPFQFTRDDGSELILNAGKTHLGIIRRSFMDTLQFS